ncbi:YOU2 family C2C2 zinc finger protein [Besnoitia besnoiti]|uniref:YOU2 family C2C2 zinc finger protein n=1 Tax=Besnoitia besnoiti TaxID=94643 RepID=A0A2A9MCK1_BESBE|nr:YOU2 family C2C2 zinc finger protein [Besnoitia besnoiti]PFH36218.1 YOU2 family C2C2 zinc finger protein [Besnoitia besnoiti]
MSSSSNGYPSLEEGARQFQRKFDDMISTFTKKTLPLQKRAFECCVSCFDLHKEDHMKIADCMTSCHQPGEAVMRAVQRETEVLQSKLESCQKTCYTRFAQPDTSVDKSKFEMERERCFTQCFAEVEPYLSEVAQRINRRIDEASP